MPDLEPTEKKRNWMCAENYALRTRLFFFLTTRGEVGGGGEKGGGGTANAQIKSVFCENLDLRFRQLSIKQALIRI